MICEPETLRRLWLIFFPEMPAPSEWCGRLAAVLKEYDVDEADLIAYLHAMFLHHNGLSNENATVAGSVRGPFGALECFGSKVTVVVQATKAGRWLERIVDFYHDIGVVPLFIADVRTSDETLAILSAKDAACINFGGGPQDDSLKTAFSAINTEWILRIHDDELPTPALWAFVERAVKHSTNFVWGFPRVHCKYDASSEDLLYSQFLPFGPLAGADLQWRLFARGDAPKERRSAPADAILFSFDWVARSFAERIEQLNTYAVDGRGSNSLTSFRLYEAIPEKWHMWARLRDKRFEQLARLMYRLRGERW